MHEALLGIVFPIVVEGRSFRDWLFHGLKNSDGRVAPRQLLLFLLAARDEAYAGRDTCYEFPVFSEGEVAAALTTVSRLSYEELVSDFRVAVNFVRNCRAGRLVEFELEEVRSFFDEEDGHVNGQLESLERLGFLDRVVFDGEREKRSKFRIPVLYTRSWGELSS